MEEIMNLHIEKLAEGVPRHLRRDSRAGCARADHHQNPLEIAPDVAKNLEAQAEPAGPGRALPRPVIPSTTV